MSQDCDGEIFRQYGARQFRVDRILNAGGDLPVMEHFNDGYFFFVSEGAGESTNFSEVLLGGFQKFWAFPHIRPEISIGACVYHQGRYSPRAGDRRTRSVLAQRHGPAGLACDDERSYLSG